MKDVDKFLIVMLIAFVVSNVIAILSPWAASHFSAMSGDSTHYMILQPIFRGFATFALNIALALWVFHQAKCEETKPLFWSLITLATGIFGPILFYVYFAYEHSKNRKTVEAAATTK